MQTAHPIRNRNSVMTWALKQLPDMSDNEFSKWCTLLEERIGMDLSEQRRAFLQSKLRLRMQALDMASYSDYLELVSSRAGLVEWSTLIDTLTIQETRFYRDPASFDLLKDFILTRSLEDDRQNSFDVWSVGCSSGEEAYSIAMILDESFSTMGIRNYYSVSGTDISLTALDKARQGVFSGRRLNNVGQLTKNRYFEKIAEDSYALIPEIKKRVCFSKLNILETDTAPFKNLDVIYCQNVLIYFKKWRRREILNQFVHCLSPGGLLILGQGEAMDWSHPTMKRMPNDTALAYIRQPMMDV